VVEIEMVRVRRFELRISWSQTRRDDQTSLHPGVSRYRVAGAALAGRSSWEVVHGVDSTR
jgi:hypothetical protein